MIYLYSTPHGERVHLSREEMPELVMDFVGTYRDDEEDRAWDTLRSIWDIGEARRRVVSEA